MATRHGWNPGLRRGPATRGVRNKQMTDSAAWHATVVGAGNNGLAASFYLGRAGLKVLVVEAQDYKGGARLTQELFPGFKISRSAHIISALQPAPVRDTRVIERGLVVSGTIFRPPATAGQPSALLCEPPGWQIRLLKG